MDQAELTPSEPWNAGLMVYKYSGAVELGAGVTVSDFYKLTLKNQNFQKGKKATLKNGSRLSQFQPGFPRASHAVKGRLA